MFGIFFGVGDVGWDRSLKKSRVFVQMVFIEGIAENGFFDGFPVRKWYIFP